MKTSRFPRRRAAIFAAVLALGTAAAWIEGRSAISRANAAADRDALLARAEEYCRLRKSGDWVALYSLADPEDRRQVELPAFLGAFGHGALRIDEIAVTAVRIDDPGDQATVDLEIVMELVPEKLPAQFRHGFSKPEDPAALRQRAPFAMGWRRFEDQWYFRIDREVVTGRHASGQEIVPLGKG